MTPSQPLFGTPSDTLLSGVGSILSPGLFQWGPVDVHPGVNYSFSYESGISAAPGRHVSTVDEELTPGVLLNLGRHWTLDYSTTLRLYSSSALPSATDQSVLLAGQTTYHDWSFNLSQGYSSSTQVLLETQAPTDEENYTTSFAASRSLGGNLSAQFGANQAFRFASEFGTNQQVREWSGSTGLNYQFWSGFGLGVSVSGGTDQISPGSGMDFEQGQVSANYQPGAKLNLSISAGMEDTQMMGQQLDNPTFSASLVYQPLERTTAALTAARSVSPSLYQDTLTVNTMFSAAVRQQLFQKLSLQASVGYSITPYEGFALITDANAFNLNGAPLSSTVMVSRRDESAFFRVSLGFPVLKRGSASVYFGETDSTSSLAAFAVNSTQFGFEFGYHY
jgi:hypothetical protein